MKSSYQRLKEKLEYAEKAILRLQHERIRERLFIMDYNHVTGKWMIKDKVTGKTFIEYDEHNPHETAKKDI